MRSVARLLFVAMLSACAASVYARTDAATPSGPPGVIDTIAGNGLTACASRGEGGAATATCADPAGVAVDASGNLYYADRAYCAVRKVTNGIVTTVVGGRGCIAPSGDGGPATLANIGPPDALAIDAAGSLYIATEDCRVRAVSGGVISTVAGSGCGFSGDGGPATAAKFSFAGGWASIAVDPAGNIYIADILHCRVREVTGGVINTIAGTGTCGLTGDGGAATAAEVSEFLSLAVDASGNLYLGGNCRVRKISAGTITLVAGTDCVGPLGDGGPATGAVVQPATVGVDAAGDLYINDNGTIGCHIRKVQAGIITTIAGGACGYSGDGGAATAAKIFSGGKSLAFDSIGNLYLADSGNLRVRIIYAPDTDGDGYTDAQEVALGKDPLTYCLIMRADLNGDGSVNVLDLTQLSAFFLAAIPPAPMRDDQNADGAINIIDLTIQTSQFLRNVSACT